MPTQDSDTTARRQTGHRWLIIGLGLLSALTAVLFTVAPVNTETTTYRWDGAQDTALPLYPYHPARLDATVRCTDANGLALATTPPEGKQGADPVAGGLEIRAVDGTVKAELGGKELFRGPVGPGCRLAVHADGQGTTVGTAKTTGKPVVTGLYTEHPGAVTAQVEPDTRWVSTPSAVKVALGVVSVLALLAMIVLLIRRDRRVARRVRLLPRRVWVPRPADLVVTGVLGIWAVIGALTVDDGYISTMLRARETSGFTGNYFRWFNAPEAPWGWYYELYALLGRVTPAMVWMRLPSVLLGLASWFLIDRLVLPRLVDRPTRWTRWATAALFLAWYLAFDVGLRPEPWIVFGSLAVFALVERAVATGAVTPLAVGLVVAGATATTNPLGIAAFLPFLAAVRPLFRLLRGRDDLRVLGAIATVAGAGASALLTAFYDQPLSAVLESTAVRQQIGPDLPWQSEINRYATLLDPSVVEGALNRRVPVLLMLLAMVLTAVLLIRRRAPGLAVGPARRMVVVSVLCLVVLAFTPTKWTHHFGALAGFGTLVIALLVHTLARGALSSWWARAATLGLVAATTWLAWSAPNWWWMQSDYDVRWGDTVPTVKGVRLADLALWAGLAVALAGALAGAWRTANRRDGAGRAPRWLPRAGWVIVAVAALTAAVEVVGQAQAVKLRWGTYSVGRSNLASLGLAASAGSAGNSCGVEDWLDVEPDIGAGVLRPSTPDSAEGFATNTAFPPEAPPRAPFGADPEHPAWSSYGSPSRTGTLVSGWYDLPAGVGSPDSPPVVISRAGHGKVQVSVEFAKADGTVLATMKAKEDNSGKWADARFDPRWQAPGAQRVRVVARDDDPGASGWVAVTAPRIPRLTPLTNVIPVHEPVTLDWTNAFVVPCRTPASLADGIVQPVRYRFAPGQDAQSLVGVSYSADAGGPYVPLYADAKATEVPTYLRGDKLREPVAVYRFDYPVAMRGLTVEHSTRSTSGLAKQTAVLDSDPARGAGK
ncbi:arabinosyltransferase domain-containing protein [Amycolatopsis circi]|uniref:arabinosyltransferase domain-containing protein n=1 Tax=Amycolatopsis circi TaxID=871959 RepID=UPI000E2265D5|nr:arabinosyltransferase domain-containing protein [Amycolatopsis circi]